MISLAISLAALGIALPYFGVTPQRMLILGALYGVQRAGVCLIGFAFSASIPALIDELGLRGTFLILSGVMLNAHLGAIFLTVRTQEGHLLRYIITPTKNRRLPSY
ncbi:hypothetical protein BIW11_09847 [Tropilaelaps mercedesae]|uniref:Major facilitator superfamily (MFS) profile domain-containing protein n=1 Tax=Tropilaelaps mercedesae TaxID=418985 RepID=A0A1V9XII9_9ACAR|nr:hypothetical protein BIW11_09847 [Tropilaelaps mercedesae]